MKKLTVEKDGLESQMKNERDEKELYKVMHVARVICEELFGCLSFLLLQTGRHW